MRHGQTNYKYEGTKHTIAFTTSGSTQQATAISKEVEVVRFISTEDCYVVFEAEQGDASATTGLTLKANAPEYFAVTDEDKISARGITTAGSLEIAEMTL